jgi:hypothetical protein
MNYSISGWDCHIRKAFHSFDYEIVFSKQVSNDEYEILQPDLKSVKKIKIGAAYDGSTIRLSRDMVKDMFNALWDDGIRPKERRYETEMSLVNNHLQDMRKLVFENK